jgi:hypothetical protein
VRGCVCGGGGVHALEHCGQLLLKWVTNEAAGRNHFSQATGKGAGRHDFDPWNCCTCLRALAEDQQVKLTSLLSVYKWVPGGETVLSQSTE